MHEKSSQAHYWLSVKQSNHIARYYAARNIDAEKVKRITH